MISALLVAAAFAFWPVWQWYVQRCADGSDEPLGLLALITFICLAVFRQENRAGAAAQPAAEERKPSKILWLCIAIIAIYCATWLRAPHLVSAIFAVLAGGMLLSQTGVVFMAADWVLLLLSLPLAASLNFYGGFPLRLLASNIAVVLLALGGVHVVGSGTTLLWHDQTVTVDQPCSGIKMLWMALYLGAVFASFMRKNLKETIVLIVVAVAAALITNALRVTSLFLLVTHQLHTDPHSEGWMHEAIGIASFALGAFIILGAAFANRQGETAKSGATASDIDVQKSKIQQSKVAPVQFAAIMALLVVAGVLPFLTPKPSHAADMQQFPGWPTTIAGHVLKPCPQLQPSQLEAQLHFDPGKMAIFTDETGRRVYIVRWITHTSREVHSASDCYRASSDSDVHWFGIRKLDDGNEYACFTSVEKNHPRPTLVCERIFDDHGHNYTDVSTWFWSSMFEQTKPPWWAVTIAESE
ncbi:MAG TPA: archaeosortase/exosortase family protein [Planktothrix sp.]